MTSVGVDHGLQPIVAAAASNRPRARGRSRKRILVFVGSPVFVGVVLLIAWELAVTGGAIDAFWVSRPRSIAERLKDWVSSGELWPDLWATVRVALQGLGLSIFVGTIVGTLQAASHWFDEIFGLFVTALNAIPKVVLLPVLLFAFGLGDTPKIALVFSLTVFIIILDVRGAFLGVDTELTDSVRIMGGSTLSSVSYGAIPQMVPQLIAALRTVLPLAWVGAVFTEFFGSQKGMGATIIQSQQTFDSTGMMAAILVISIVGTTADRLLARTNRHFDSWRPATG